MILTRTQGLSASTLADLPADIARPGYDRGQLGVGIVHLGVGAFHRAHQAVYTDDAIAARGGDWGIAGVSLQRPDMAQALNPQGGLYTVEVLDKQPCYRVIGALLRMFHAPSQAQQVIAALAAPTTHVVTLTVTEKGYGFAAGGLLDRNRPDVAHDLRGGQPPLSTVGWLAAGLRARHASGGAPITIVSCDNLSDNGARLGAAVENIIGASDPALSRWLRGDVRFPNTMVDCIVPASTPASRARVQAATGLEDAASVQREVFSQWVIQDDFAGPRPAWEVAGAQFVDRVEPHEKLKLHVLNASHSALAYLGLRRGCVLVREAIADPEIAGFLDAMMIEETAPALPDLDVAAYWAQTRRRFANPMVDHSLAQIAQDGSIKLAQRIFPLIADNARAGRSPARMIAVARAWLELASSGRVVDPQAARLQPYSGPRGLEAALDDLDLFPQDFRLDPAVRAAVAENG